MMLLRSTLFMVLMVLATPLHAVFIMLSFPLPHRTRRKTVMPWVHMTSWLTEHLLGIRYEVIGRENIRPGAAVILAKHQSAWETIMLQEIFDEPLFVWKKELKYLPFFGWALATQPSISIDRKAGKDALKQLVEQGRLRLEQGYPIIIFPEGTRVPPGQKKRYKIGGAHLAAATGAPVLPVALNSGEFWRRNAFIKRPGTITVSIGPAIEPAGLTADEINRRAEAWMENEMRRISPQLYADTASGRVDAG